MREPVRACVYVPFFQQPPDRIGFGAFEVRASGSLSAVAADLQRVLSRQLPGAPLQIRPFTAQVEDSIRREILMAQLAGFFGILALILAAVGLYGLLAYAAAILIALPVGWWACRFIAAMLYGIERPFDPATVAVAVVMLTFVALAAGFVPARRAAKVDPMIALRQD